jgi:TolB-like protein/DNA-binding winged helix-turn-helix (wHTH) protein/Tfp pilus assembly protein PilF
MLEQRKYRFGEFTLDIGRGALLRGVDEVRLRPKSFAVLQALVERHGQLVTKDELLDLVWGRTVVTDGAVTQCLIDVRRALGDDAQEIIRTVPRRGYIFTLPVTLEAAQVAPPAAAGPATTASGPTRMRRMLGLATLLAVLGALAWWGTSTRLRSVPEATSTTDGASTQAKQARKAIAVLPFANLTGDPDGEYVADGIADELVHLLAQGQGFRVIARTSSFAFKGQSKSIDEIARKLRVDYVVEGSVRRAGTSLRVNVQLIDAASSSNVWSKAYEREMRDLVAVHEDIAQNVATALKTSLASNGPRAVAHEPDPAAYDAFMRARFFFQRRFDGDLDKAELAYREALRLDPRMARAWAGLAGVYNVRIGETGADVDRLLREQKAAAEAAISLDPQLAEARMRAAAYYYQTGDLARAQREAELARDLSPDEPAVLWWFATDQLVEGRYDEAVDVVRRIVASDPASSVARVNLANTLLVAGRLDEARDEFKNFMAMAEQPVPDVAVDLARIDLLSGRDADALNAARNWPDGPDRDFVLAMADARLQHAGEARAAEARLLARESAAAAVRLAELYARRGDANQAFRWMNLAYDRLGPEPWLTDQWQWLYHLRLSPFLTSLQGDARWAPTVRRGEPRPRQAARSADSAR